MDDDDPCMNWPAWKFGMKREAIFTTLHDQYNTFTYTLQDPEAFHSDVNEIARNVDTVEEFHRFMAHRQQQRLAELHESLESLAVEIIANPKLIGSDQWQHALQLFRTKSFDSIVRYFASYLPDHYLDRHSVSSASSFSEADSIHTTTTASTFLDDDFFPNGPAMTCEPFSIDASEMPLSPRSEAEDCCSIHMCTGFVQSDDDETSQSDDCDTAVTSVCDSAETRSSFDPADDVDVKELPVHIMGEEDDDDEFPTAQHPDDDFCTLTTFDTPDTLNNYDTPESDTPTPRQVPESTCYVEYKSAIARKSPLPRSRLAHRAEGGPLRDIRRSPEEALSKIQKPDSIRKRPKGRRWLD